jgi:hypothetical protein
MKAQSDASPNVDSQSFLGYWIRDSRTSTSRQQVYSMLVGLGDGWMFLVEDAVI